MKDKKFLLKLIFIIVIPLIIAVLSVGFAGIMQAILVYERYGFVFKSGIIFIPHWSAWFFFGIVGVVPATLAEQIL